ncbi:transglutaminase family protein [Sphingomonas jatrophae]|uniref:Transglutaminase-like enzyme, putative cysteine protease n=1 Tax=Sphingomonas jatrophae TaxID=1166337 RepID=A0A1I6LGK2_9SPHN|nr:transglutaminase family protein [Sphingomonas jatrophae]SFS02542.1 Transglutaminase-like enzyme, putative cysteine protease [Sphingomonas jatrophae]
MRLRISHRTVYRFTEPQARVVQLLRLTPGSHYGQTVVDWRIDVDCDARLKASRDGFGNETHMLYAAGPLDAITLSVHGEVLTDDRAGVVAGAAEPLPPLAFLQATQLTKVDPAIAAFAAAVPTGDTGLEHAHALMHAVHERVAYRKSWPDPARTAAEALEAKTGVGQDLTHVLVASARSLGIPARYVSGHYCHDGGASDEAGHAWAELHVEGFGWIGFDAANAMCPDDRYVRVAIGLDARGAAPVSGTRIGGGDERLEVGVTVESAASDS